MPELPEVETIRRQLNGAVIGRRIAAINATWATSLVATQQDLRAAITARICGVERQGKLLIIATDGGVSLLVHLRMTGQLLLGNADQADRLNGFVLISKTDPPCDLTINVNSAVFR